MSIVWTRLFAGFLDWCAREYSLFGTIAITINRLVFIMWPVTANAVCCDNKHAH
jgi:hypothetical protein